jgi:hypothetical protein
MTESLEFRRRFWRRGLEQARDAAAEVPVRSRVRAADQERGGERFLGRLWPGRGGRRLHNQLRYCQLSQQGQSVELVKDILCRRRKK